MAYSYNGNGYLTQTLNTGDIGETINYYYEMLGRLTSKLTNFGPFSRSVAYTYDQVGNNTGVVSGAGTVSYFYNEKDQVIQIGDQNSLITTFEYDGTGNQTAVHHPNGISTYTYYDAMSRVTGSVTSNVPPPQPPLQRSILNRSGKRSQNPATEILDITDCAITQIITPFTGPNLSESEPVMIQVENTGGLPVLSFDFSYNVDNGPFFNQTVIQSLLPGEMATFIFDQTTDLSIPGQTYQVAACVNAVGDENPGNNCLITLVTHQISDPIVFQSFTYQYDPAGNILSEIRNGGESSVLYGYSARNELISESFLPSGDLNLYTYTPTGYRASKSDENNNLEVYQYNNDDVLLAAGDVVFETDANGNRTSMTETNGTTQYVYGFENELKHVILPDLAFISFDYSALGIKLKKNNNCTSRYFMTDRGAVLEEYNAAGLPITYHNPDLSIFHDDSAGYYYYNGFASSVLQLDSAMTMLASAGYDRFVNQIYTTGRWIDDRLVFNSVGYISEIDLHDRGGDIYTDPLRGIGINPEPPGGLRGRAGVGPGFGNDDDKGLPASVGNGRPRTAGG